MVTNREQFLKQHGLPLTESLSLLEISKLSGIPKKALEEVEQRGYGAYRNNIASVRIVGTFKKNPDVKKYGASMRLTPYQWAYGRIYAFVNKSPRVYYGADNDIRLKYGLK
jgi:hypothetical protein